MSQNEAKSYRVTLVESQEGFAVWCDDLPGCASQGRTREEALENIREAIREWLEVQDELPAQVGARVTHEEVTV